MGAGKVPATPRARDKGKADKRREKKTYYAKLKKDEDDKMAELAEKYRDRAKERRDGGPELPPGVEDAGAYRAVAPNARESHDAAERRRQMIHESKYLGGDMDHTHLVKGLDFALLQKVRSEIETREEAAAEESGDEEDKEEEEEEEREEGPGGSKPVFGNRKARRAEAKKAKDDIVNADKEAKVKKAALEDVDEEKKDEIACRTIMGKNIIRTIFKPEQQKVNELFIAGRMAYVMDLEEEVETDIPTTSIRSKKDVINNEQKATLSTNDIVINKLTQILSYLRAGTRSKKKKKHDILFPEEVVVKEEPGLEKPREKVVDAGISIYDDDDLGKRGRDEKKERRDRGREGERRRDDRREERRGRDDRDDKYGRDRHREREDKEDRYRDDRYSRDDRGRDEKQVGSSKKPVSYFDKPAEQPVEEKKGGFSAEDKELIKAMMKKEEMEAKKKDEKKLEGLMSNDGYAECYPGLAEMDDAMGDSDDEADFNKMDQGNKRGPMSRFDFDTQEEYANYKSQQEAMPKAAYQYGMKVSDGRKTKGKIGQKNEKAKLDKEWNKISALIDKRKSGGGGDGGGKKARYDD